MATQSSRLPLGGATDTEEPATLRVLQNFRVRATGGKYHLRKIFAAVAVSCAAAVLLYSARHGISSSTSTAAAKGLDRGDAVWPPPIRALTYGDKGHDEHKKIITDFSKVKPRDTRGGAPKFHQRPVIHTFYARDEHHDEQSVLMEWFTAWYDAGWQPWILTMKDVQSHPDYEAHREFVESNPKWTQSRIWRWFAMSTVEGGGYLADFDVYPLANHFGEGRDLPNNGRLTTYLDSNPILVSGARAEFERAREIFLGDLKAYMPGAGKQPWSDVKAARSITNRAAASNIPAPFLTEHKVLKGQDLVSFEGFNHVDCDEIRKSGVVAVLFATSSIEFAKANGDIDAEVEAEVDRHKVAAEWLAKWKVVCEGDANKAAER